MGEVAPQRVVVLGAGRVATHLVPSLIKAGCQVAQVWSRTETSARLLAEPLAIPYTESLDAIVTDAKQKAYEITSSVSDTCDEIIDVYMAKVKAEREKLVKCEAAVAEFKDMLFEAYKKHIELIDKVMPDCDPTPYLSDEDLESKAVEFANEKISSTIGEAVVSTGENAVSDAVANDANDSAEPASN